MGEAVRDDAIGEGEDIDFQLAFVGTVGSDRNDQGALLHPRGADSGARLAVTVDDDIGIGDCLLECFGDDGVHAGCHNVRDARGGSLVPPAPRP